MEKDWDCLEALIDSLSTDIQLLQGGEGGGLLPEASFRTSAPSVWLVRNARSHFQHGSRGKLHDELPARTAFRASCRRALAGDLQNKSEIKALALTTPRRP
eukprot:scaffold269526_cov30-Tisochrysis_lutea.AAC.5